MMCAQPTAAPPAEVRPPSTDMPYVAPLVRSRSFGEAQDALVTCGDSRGTRSQQRERDAHIVQLEQALAAEQAKVRALLAPPPPNWAQWLAQKYVQHRDVLLLLRDGIIAGLIIPQANIFALASLAGASVASVRRMASAHLPSRPMAITQEKQNHADHHPSTP